MRETAGGAGGADVRGGQWRATALERRLETKGGYCDCEVLMNAYVRRDDFLRELAGDRAAATGERLPTDQCDGDPQ